MSKKENTKTEIVVTESVYLGREHTRFLGEVIQQLQDECGYKSTKSQLIRLLVEGAMRRHFSFTKVTNEDELRQALNSSSGDATRIIKK